MHIMLMIRMKKVNVLLCKT